MPATRLDVCAHARSQAVALHVAVVILELEVQGSGLEEYELILLNVVLQAERVALIDVDQFPQVTIGDRPAELEAPRFVHPSRTRWMDGFGGLGHSLAPTAIRSDTPLWFSRAAMSCSTRS